MSMPVGPVYAPRDHAGFIRRTLALVIDGIFLTVALHGVLWGWYYLAPVRWVNQDAYDLIEASWYILSIAYLCGMRLTTRGTLGYRLMRIEYVYMLRARPSRWALAFRAVLAPLLMAFFTLDHLWILVDKRKQAWHDKVTGFYVVKRGAQPLGQVRMLQRAVNFMLLTFIVWEPADDAPAAETQVPIGPNTCTPIPAAIGSPSGLSGHAESLPR